MTKEELIYYDRAVHNAVGCGYGVRHSIMGAEWPHYKVMVSFKLANDGRKEFCFGTWNSKREAEEIIKEIKRWCCQK